ncbi:hypothetical protein DPMN_138107 [Dreissena polymorpha]|uniref:Uncharacterized protein n=1 Tax=Dreissena polymorpha TaxID=45954 RepID=A0A9D4G3N6_DREPO|nr:hypothetical protein DPMN_138107 [Dreissena polymorpha]
MNFELITVIIELSVSQSVSQYTKTIRCVEQHCSSTFGIFLKNLKWISSLSLSLSPCLPVSLSPCRPVSVSERERERERREERERERESERERERERERGERERERGERERAEETRERR